MRRGAAGTRRGDRAVRGRGGKARSGEEGFVLLLIFAMAAAVALMLYMELPRVSFEAQRNREQLLIERGEQYKRAIQLYFRKFKTYPASIEQLESTNNVRFLRRRYPDPLTGKSEWRLIHIGPGGVFTDSLTRKPKKDEKKEEERNPFMTGPQLGAATPAAGTQPGGGAPPRRPSEGGQPQPGGDVDAGFVAASQPGAGQLNPSGDPNQPVAGQPPGAPQSPVPPGVPQSPVSAFPGAPANPFNPGAPQGSATSPNGQPQQQPVNPSPFGQPGADPNQSGGGQAADLIRNLLTRPRPLPGSSAPGAAAGGAQIGVGSIAGVASKVEKQSIKIYNEREQYNEWEFIYDFSQDRTGAGRLAGNVGAGDPRLAQPGGQPTTGAPGFGGQPSFAAQPGSGFGAQPAFGAQPGFGSQPGAGGGFGQPQQPTTPQPQPQPSPFQPPPPPPPPPDQGTSPP